MEEKSRWKGLNELFFVVDSDLFSSLYVSQLVIIGSLMLVVSHLYVILLTYLYH